jgi:hypothetical protein
VARHASENSGAIQDSHLIAHAETQRIAESFMAASPWLGDMHWSTGIDHEFWGFIDPADSRLSSAASSGLTKTNAQ